MVGPVVVSAAHPPLVWGAAALVGLAVLVLPGRPRPPRRPRAAPRGGGGAVVDVDPPLLLDLVAAVVSAGSAPVAAVSAVARVLREAGGPGVGAAEALDAAAAAGAGPAASSLGAPRPTGAAGPEHLADALAALQRCLWIAEQTGAPVAALLSSAATELRRRRRRAAALAAARLGVRVVAPLGLCTLPAFGLLAVVPVLLSLGRDLLG
nr:type II secretion system F family protein [Quadrisphaera sp. RL12-1S]